MWYLHGVVWAYRPARTGIAGFFQVGGVVGAGPVGKHGVRPQLAEGVREFVAADLVCRSGGDLDGEADAVVEGPAEPFRADRPRDRYADGVSVVLLGIQ
jgi:hypothetical protein